MEIGDLMALIRRRLWLVVALTVIGGVAGYVIASGSDAKNTYSQTVSLAIRPASDLQGDAVSRVVATLDSSESALSRTILGFVASSRIQVARDPKKPSVATPELRQGAVQWDASLRPGTNIIDVSFTGKDPALLNNTSAAYINTVKAGVSRFYNVYALDVISPPSDPKAGAKPTRRDVVLGAGAGLILALALILLEGLLRPVDAGPPARRTPASSVDEPAPAGDAL